MTIRIEGDVSVTPASIRKSVCLPRRSEINAATGSLVLAIQQRPQRLSRYRSEKHLHRHGDILAKLEEDPRYDGYVAELNAPAAGSVLTASCRAAVVTLNDDDSQLAKSDPEHRNPRYATASVSDLSFADSEDELGSTFRWLDQTWSSTVDRNPTGRFRGARFRDAFVRGFGTESSSTEARSTVAA